MFDFVTTLYKENPGLHKLNLLDHLAKYKTLKNVHIYGHIRHIYSPGEAPGHVGDLTVGDGGRFCLVDVVGYRLLRAENGLEAGFYLAPGTIVTVLSVRYGAEAGNFLVMHGSKSSGCTVKTGNYGNAAETVQSFSFRKVDNSWVAFPTFSKYMHKMHLDAPESEDIYASMIHNTHGHMSDYVGDYADRVYNGCNVDELPAPVFLNSTFNPNNSQESEADSSDSASLEVLGTFVNEQPVIYRVRNTEEPKNRINGHINGSEPAGGPSELVHRSDVLPYNDAADDVQDELLRCSEAIFKFRDDVMHSSRRDLLWRRDAFLVGFNSLLSGTGKVGSASVKTLRDAYLESVGIESDEIREYANEIQMGVSTIFDSDKNEAFFRVLDFITGVSTFDRFSEDEDLSDMVDLLLTNPYAFGLIVGMSCADSDKLFFALSCIDERDRVSSMLDELSEYRDMLIGLDKLISADETSTLVPKRSLLSGNRNKYSPRGGVPFTSNKSDIIRAVVNYGATALDTCYSATNSGAELIKTSLEPGTDYVCTVWAENYETTGFNPDGKPQNAARMFQDLDDHGLAVSIDDDIISYTMLKMETFIYKKTWEMGNTLTGVTQEVLDAVIAEYEDEKGFKLEQLQKDGVGIVKHSSGVLSGQAGSGKTTVSEVFIRALNRALPEYKVKLAAPTGKAARRMKEVVGHLGDVKTIHSLFKLGVGDVRAFQSSDEFLMPSEPKTIYIMDEMAMCTTDVLYKVLKRLSSDSLIYFLGDIKQLPPIGKGVPFRDMLSYMPAVELGVSKRAAEGSGINKNCDIINQHSTGPGFLELEQTDDFRLVSVNDADIVDTLLHGVRANAPKYGQDGLQVATPYASDAREHGSIRLNPKLQDIFLPDAAPAYTLRSYNGVPTTFRVGAKVIHTRVNMRGKMKYYRGSGNVFIQAPSAGIMNGELGEIVEVLPYSEVEIHEDEAYNAELAESGIEAIPDTVEGSKAGKTCLVVVKVYDADVDQDLYVLYHGNKYDYTEVEGYTLTGGTVRNLELAYALTVHKLQGSQAKMIVIPLSSKDNPGFVNRNMLYTAISRAQEYVALIGSVQGANSMASMARRNTSVHSVRTMHQEFGDDA